MDQSNWLEACGTNKIPHSALRSLIRLRPGWRCRRSTTGSSRSIRLRNPSGTIHGSCSLSSHQDRDGITQPRELNVSVLSLMVNFGHATEANELVGPANRVFPADLGPSSNPTHPMGTFVEVCRTY
jgi:hypothetical protein